MFCSSKNIIVSFLQGKLPVIVTVFNAHHEKEVYNLRLRRMKHNCVLTFLPYRE
jgi:hypothetical protein